MPSPFTQLTVDEKTLLHLSQFIFSKDDEAPLESTQEGIADGTGISTTHVPRSVQGLRKKGLVEELKVPVVGTDRRRKVYLCTEDGFRKAQATKAKLLDAPLVVREADDSLRQTTVRELHGSTATVTQILRVVLEAEALPVLDRSETQAGVPKEGVPGPTAASLYTRIPNVPGFVGRKGELKELQSALRDPKVRLIVVTGIAGIGKTTLVAKAVQRTRKEQVFWYRLHEWETLRNIGFVMGEFLAELGKPEFQQYMEGNEEHDVAEAYEIVQSALEGIETTIVLDDFDKAPRSLVGFVRTFLPHLDRFEGLKFVAITRASIPFFSETDRIEGRVVEMTLSGLSEEDAKRMLPGRQDPEVVAGITRMTEGHPLLLKLFSKVEGPDGEPVEEQLVHSEGLIRFVTDEVLGSLGFSELRALEAASVHRYPVPPEALFIAEEVDYDTIDALRRKQLMRSVAGRYVEPVDFVREFVYQRLKPDQRRTLHHQAAEALVATDLPGVAWEVPRHLLLSGRPAEAAEATLAAAPAYVEEGRIERFGNLVRELLQTPTMPAQQAAQLAQLRASMYDRVGDPARAKAWRKRADQLAAGRLQPGEIHI